MRLTLNDENFIPKDHIKSMSGVYKMLLLDENGVLYIGQSENLLKRLTKMKQAFDKNYKSNKHIAVRKIQSIPYLVFG